MCLIICSGVSLLLCGFWNRGHLQPAGLRLLLDPALLRPLLWTLLRTQGSSTRVLNKGQQVLPEVWTPLRTICTLSQRLRAVWTFLRAEWTLLRSVWALPWLWPQAAAGPCRGPGHPGLPACLPEHGRALHGRRGVVCRRWWPSPGRPSMVDIPLHESLPLAGPSKGVQRAASVASLGVRPCACQVPRS